MIINGKIEANKKIATLEKRNKELTDVLKKSLKLNELQKQEFNDTLEAINACVKHPTLCDRNKLSALGKFLGFIDNHRKDKEIKQNG